MGGKIGIFEKSPYVPSKKYLKLSLVKGQCCSVIELRARFSIACPENQTGKYIFSYSFSAITLELLGHVLGTNSKSNISQNIVLEHF